jgi:hypothetical protein
MRVLATFLASVCGIFLVGCGSSSTTPTFNGSSNDTTTGAGGGSATTTTGAGGGSSTTTGAGGSGPDMMMVDTTSKVAVDGIVTAGPWTGAAFTATENGTVSPDCSSGTACAPPFAGSNMCMEGKVTGMADYSGFAMLGWNVNQPMGAGNPATWMVPATGGLTVTAADIPSSVALRVQLQGTDPHDAADRWCAQLVPGKQIAWTDFKTNCWTGGKPQTPLAAGTMIQQAAVTVPGLTIDLPFKVCLVDIQIQ